jgi:hyperosmotically inducible periplasmic protein
MEKQMRDLSIEDLSKKSGVIPKRLIVACDLCARHSLQYAEYKKGRNNPMKSSAFSLWILLTAVPVVSIVGCTSLTGQTTGQYVDDRTITSTVKAKLVADKAANLTRVDVDTTNRVVSLNGIVESREQKARAEQLAMQVSGVKDVKNNLQIQGSR